MWQKFQEWAASPFDPEMDALHWFLFLGLLLVIMIAWRIILKTITED
ncbi:MAG: hypothetical protein KGL39_36550 [Patescibacteria group bacterium]|nr:hypothetical protein [Patescibacteria group bacterium]